MLIKKIKVVLAILCLNFIFISDIFSQPCNMAGVYSIGTGSTYFNIRTAVHELTLKGIGASVYLELSSTYDASNDTFPINFDNIPCISASRGVTIRPALNVSDIAISDINTIFALGNSRYITIDGRKGGQGLAIGLTLISSATNGAIQFWNDGSFNTVEYVEVISSNPSLTNGAISFNTSIGGFTNGNSHNLISHCKINGGALNLIYSSGSPGKKNSFNTIENCELYNFSSAAIRLDSNNSDWRIESNQIYCQSPSSNISGISVDDSTSSGFQISDNWIGGSGIHCGGVAMNVQENFRGISLSAGRGENNIQGNHISNIEWTNVSSTVKLICIQILSGKVKCGTQSGNIIGSDTAFGNIHTTSRYLSEPEVCGIQVGQSSSNASLDSIFIFNNNIGGIFCEYDSTNSLNTMLRGIYVNYQQSGILLIENNNIGSATQHRSMYSISVADVPTRAIDIENSTASNKDFVVGNVVHGIAGAMHGINITGGINIIEDNLIADCLNDEPDVTGFTPGFAGINLLGCERGTIVRRNTIRNFVVRAPYGGGNIGIYADLVSGIDISQNFIHDFYSTANYAVSYGIFLQTENGHRGNSITNNMIRLGADSSGQGSQRDEGIDGIFTYFDSTIVSHNTVYINGTGNGQTCALRFSDIYGTGNRLTNNILINKRQANGSNAYNNYSLYSEFNPISLTGMIMDHNIFENGGTNNYVAGELNFPVTNYPTLTDWTTHSGYDLHSQIGDPNFIQPDGDINMLNLHLQLPSIADAAGIMEASILYDIDNDLRSSLSPVDIGADAFDGTNNLSFVIRENIILFPNPSVEKFQIRNLSAMPVTEINIYDLDGRLVYHQLLSGNEIIDIKTLSNGIYVCELLNLNNEKMPHLLIKQN